MLPLKALNKLFKAINQLEERFDKKIDILGFLLTEYDKRTNLSKEIFKNKELFNHLPSNKIKKTSIEKEETNNKIKDIWVNVGAKLKKETYRKLKKFSTFPPIKL